MYFMQTNTETVQCTVRIPFELLVEDESVTSLAAPKHADVSIQDVNSGADVVFDLEIPEDLK